VHDRSPSAHPRRAYRAFGLLIRSEVELPELAAADPASDDPGDLTITRGVVAERPGEAKRVDPSLWVTPTDAWLETAVGRFHASRGRTIIVDASSDASQREVRLYVLGTMAGAILHQRGILPLHANAIVLGDHAIAVAGPSGAGKSTLAAYFHDRGRAVLCDDVCAVRIDPGGGASAQPGVARIKLWADALGALGRDPSAFEPVVDGLGKFSFPVSKLFDGDRPLKRIYLLEPVDRERISTRVLAGAEAVNALLSNIYRWSLAVESGLAPVQFANAAAVARACEVVSLRCPRGLDGLPELARHLDPALPALLPETSERH